MRIYPAFWCLIGVSLVFQFLKSGTLDFSALSAELLFYQNYHWPAIWDHTWTLAVEEHFYLLLPMGLLLGRRGTRTDAKPFRWLPLGCFLLMAGCLLWRISLHLRGFDYRSAAFLTPTQLRIDSLAYGVLLSWLYHFHQRLWQRVSRHRLLLSLVAVIGWGPSFIFVIEYTPFIYTYGFSLLSMASCAVIMLVIEYPIPLPPPLVALVAWIGQRSYAIYLWHLPFKWWVVGHLHIHRVGTLSYLLYLVIYMAGSILTGAFFTVLVEAPALAIRNRLFPSPKNLRLKLRD